MIVKRLRTGARWMLVAGALAVGGCGEDETAEVTPREPAGQPSTATPTPATTPSPTATPQATATPGPAPEEQQGGAGDEDGIEQRARYVVGAAGTVTPPEIEVTAFLPVRVSFENRTPRSVRVELGGLADDLVVPPGAVADVRLDGPRPGRYELRAGGAVTVLQATAGGAG